MITRRSGILYGPSIATFLGSTLYFKGDLNVTISSTSPTLEVGTFGVIDQSDDDFMIEISGEPSGEVTNDLLALYLPFFQGAFYPGTPLWQPGVDNPLVIITRDGQMLTAASAALTTPGSITAAGTKTLLGGVKFTGLRMDNTDWATPGSLFSRTTGEYPGDAAFNRSNIIRQPFFGKWLAGVLPKGAITGSGASPDVFSDAADHGLAPGDTVTQSGFASGTLKGTFLVATTPTTKTYTLYQVGTTTPVTGTGGAEAGGQFVRANLGDTFAQFDTEAGFTITPNVSLTPDKTDNGGVINMLFQKSSVSCEAVVAGPSIDDVIGMLKSQGGTAVRGQSLAARSVPLYMSSSGIYMKMPLAGLTSGALTYGATKKRIGKLKWESVMNFDEGVPESILQVSTAPID